MRTQSEPVLDPSIAPLSPTAAIVGRQQELGLNSTFSPLESNLADQPAVVGLPVGQRAPGFHLVDLSGETVALDSFLVRGKPTLLAVTDPGCGPCNTLLPDLGQWQRERATDITLVVISRG